VQITRIENRLELLDYEQNNLARALTTSWTELAFKKGKWSPSGGEDSRSVTNDLPD
jgi:hypothetical protein